MTKLLWLQAAGCGGCTMSLLCAESPGVTDLLADAGINLLWHPALSLQTGAEALGLLNDVAAGRVPLDILCVEGAIARGPAGTGRFQMLSGTGQSMLHWVTRIAARARHVVAVGTCAAFGGVTAAGGNPTDAVGLQYDGARPGGLLPGDWRSTAGVPVINVAGCPTHPAWVTETLLMLAAGDAVALDGYNRPRFYADHLVHHGCPKNEFYEYKASARSLSESGCLMENLGCIGTQAVGDCNIRPWNGEGSCTRGGYPCINCTAPQFEDPAHAFVETPKIAGIPVGLPTDMPKAWFMALASLSKAATPNRIGTNAHAEMTARLVVGPFNRVEGDLEVTLDLAEGRVASARVNAPLYRGFEVMLQGRDPRDALVITPRICGICSISQSAAAARALGAAMGLEPSAQGAMAAALIHAAENAADHLTHFHLFFMPDFARPAYAGRSWHARAVDRFTALEGGAQRTAIAARAELLHVMGLLAGKWPHTLAIQPGGVTRAPGPSEKVRLAAMLRAFRRYLETTLFGGRLEDFITLQTPEALMRWPGGDVALFLEIAADLDFAAMGCGAGRYLSYGAYPLETGPVFAAGFWDGGLRAFDPAAIREDLGHAWMQGATLHPFDGETRPEPAMAEPGYSWCKAPRLAGRPMETGALARQVVDGAPLARALAVQGGVLARVAGRLYELARTQVLMETLVAGLTPGAAFMAHGSLPREGRGAGLVEAARGALGHWLCIEGGRIASYQIIAPTTWNFSPRDGAGTPGPLEAALVGAAVGEGETAPLAVQHIVRSFDPCMVCTVH